MPQPSLNLVVLRTTNLEKTRNFYQAVGLNFVAEQHNNGPTHYACTLGETVIEIYPGIDACFQERREAGATMLGFRVDNLDNILSALAEIGVVVLSDPNSSVWGRRAVVQDPDGRSVDLTQSVILRY